MLTWNTTNGVWNKIYGTKLWERGIRRVFSWNKKMCTWNKNRIRGKHVSLRGMKSGIARGIMWNKK